MRHSLLKFPTFVLCLLVSLSAAAGGVSLKTLDGEDTGLGALLSKDRWTLVMVWTTYCGVCRKQYPMISEFHRTHAPADAVVLGISLDGFGEAGKVARYQEEQGHTFPSALSEPGDFAEKYAMTTGHDFTGTPTYLLFDREQALRAYLDGPITIEAIEKFIAKD